MVPTLPQVLQHHIRSIHKRIYVPKPYQTLHPEPKEPVKAVPCGPIEHPVIDFFTKKQTGTIKLDRTIFGAPLRLDILQRVVIWQLDKRRQGTHKGKTRAEVRGGGRKPWRQKGTGRARIGSRRAPHWRGGGAVFPPTPRDHSTGLPVKLRAFGMKVALSAKLAQGNLHVVDSLQLPSHKTKELALGLLPKEYGSALIVEKDTITTNLDRAAANVGYVDAMIQEHVNVYDLISRKSLVITRDALEKLTARVQSTLLGYNALRMKLRRELVEEEIREHEEKIKKQGGEKKEAKKEVRERKKVPKKME